MAGKKAEKNQISDWDLGQEEESLDFLKKKSSWTLEEVKRELRRRLGQELEGRRQMEDEELSELIDAMIQQAGETLYLPLAERVKLREELYNSFKKLDILQELVDNPQITEIMVNGEQSVFVEKGGAICRWNRSFETREQLEDLIQQIVSRVNRTVNAASPIADARLEDGSRVHVVLPPVALDGPVLTIRKFPEPITMERLISLGSVTETAAGFLKKLVKSGYNLFISGGTGSGKTTFLNALSEFIPEEERLITIEDSAELQITHVPNLVRLETRAANHEGSREITIRDLIRASLRMRPDRILVGEVRGAEALEMLQSMNTGHSGSISTGHANSSRDMLLRLETMVLMGADLPLAAIRSQIASAIDIFIHLGRLRDRSRKVLEIEEVTGIEDGEIALYPLYKRIDLKQRRQEELKRQFKESVLMLSSSLAAGYSMENSFAQAQAQLEEMYGERGMMSKEFAVMRSQLSMNRTLEELWGDFAKRSGIEEIRSFAQIFKAARRSGGQLGMIISHVSEIIGGKIQVQEEIRLMTAQKQFEQKIMNLLPLLIVLYIDLTSPGFFDTMYQTAAGRIVMTVCMLVYAGAYILAGRMLDIEI